MKRPFTAAPRATSRSELPASPRLRRRPNPLFAAGIREVTWKDIQLLKYFVSERGRILPARTTGLDAKQQRMVTRAIKQARQLGLLPYLRHE